MNNIFKSKLIKTLLYISIIIGLSILILKIDVIREIMYILLFSFILSYVLKPIKKFLVHRGIKSKNAALILVVSVILGVIVIFTVLIPSIFKESLNIGNYLDEVQKYTNILHEKLKLVGNNKTIYKILDTLYNKGYMYFIKLFNKLLDSTVSIGENILEFIMVPIITYYFLSDSEYIENKALLFCPLKGRKIIKRINEDIDKILGRYIVSQFILCFLVGILTFIVLIIFKVKFPIMLSIANGVFNIIPYFGPVIGMVPPIIIAFIQSPKLGLYTFICLYLIQLVEGNIISPKVTGESVSMHPLAVIIVLLIGGEIGGFLGMVLAVPISVIIKVIYEDINYYLF